MKSGRFNLPVRPGRLLLAWLRHPPWSGIQLFAWLLFFGLTIYRKADLLYLADTQRWILWGGGGLLGVAFLAGLLFPEPGCGCHSEEVGSDWWRQLLESAGHFVPLMLLLLLGNVSLTLTGGAGATSSIRILMPQEQVALPDLASVPPGEYLPVTLIDLYVGEHYDDDAPVELVGRLLPLPESERAQYQGIMAGKVPEIILYRYAMACCAADASPVPAVLLEVEPHTLEPHAWVHIQGRTTLFRESPKLLAIRVESMT
ncbi:MAG: hypothetical protein HQL52_17085 [Magnetococcales bacterium]|nr:hypothetical protein [Magnetococcales bacterium]